MVFLAYKIILGLRSHPCWCFNASCRLFYGFLVVCPMFLLDVKVTIVIYDDHIQTWLLLFRRYGCKMIRALVSLMKTMDSKPKTEEVFFITFCNMLQTCNRLCCAEAMVYSCSENNSGEAAIL